MLTRITLLSREGIELDDVACRHRRGAGDSDEHAGGHAIVFVRRGCFARSVEGVTAIYDPTLAYCLTPAQEQRYDHPHDSGDDCTVLRFSGALIESLCGGERSLPPGPIVTGPGLDLQHRLLLAAARRRQDEHALVERCILLAADVIEQHDPRPVTSGRPSTARARQQLADNARERLAADPGRSLTDLSGELAVSPHHLSRVFRQVTGQTISGHRVRLRVRTALERIAGGNRDLARLAAELGFSDQSHLARCVRMETHATPSALRRALSVIDH